MRRFLKFFARLFVLLLGLSLCISPLEGFAAYDFEYITSLFHFKKCAWKQRTTLGNRTILFLYFISISPQRLSYLILCINCNTSLITDSFYLQRDTPRSYFRYF